MQDFNTRNGFIVNGRFCDGGEHCQFGWQRFSPYFRHVNWCEKWTLSHVGQLKVYDRILMTAETFSFERIPLNSFK